MIISIFHLSPCFISRQEEANDFLATLKLLLIKLLMKRLSLAGKLVFSTKSQLSEEKKNPRIELEWYMRGC